MLYDLPAVLPFVVVVAVLAVLGSIASIAVLSRSAVRNHRARIARQQSIPAYYRRFVLAR